MTLFQCKQVTATVHSKNIMTFMTLDLRDDHSGNIVGQDQEFWILNAVKRRFEERWKRYNRTLFLWDYFRDCTNWKMHHRKWYFKRFHCNVVNALLGQVFLRVLQFSPINIIPPWLSILVYHLRDKPQAHWWHSSDIVWLPQHEQQQMSYSPMWG
jgi:hypothetical protein